MMRKAIGSIVLLAFANIAYAEQMYVSDKLVVGVFPEAGSETGKVASLESGDLVEVLERNDKFIRVRLSDNREGWVKANYLSTQVPAIVRLKELQSTGATPAAVSPSPQATEELKKLKDLNTSLQTEIGALKQAAQVAAAQVAATQPTTPTVQTAAQQIAPVSSASETQGQLEGERTLRDEQPDSRQHLIWVAGIGLVCSGLGYLLGYQSLARRIRSKYGNVKIY